MELCEGKGPLGPKSLHSGCKWGSNRQSHEQSAGDFRCQRQPRQQHLARSKCCAGCVSECIRLAPRTRDRSISCQEITIETWVHLQVYASPNNRSWRTLIMNDGSEIKVKSRRLKLRWLAASAGVVMVPGCFSITVFYLVLPAILIVGAVIAGRWPRLGRWLIWIGASLLSVLVLPWCVAIFLHPGGRVDFMISACIASAILLPLCNVALIVDVVKGRNTKRA
jgi:hypothetical protein